MDNDQKKADQEYSLTENELLVSSTDLKGNITFVNENFIRVSGYTQDELIGNPHNMVRHPDMPKEAFKDLWNDISEGKSWSGIIKNKQKSGGFYWVKSDVILLYQDGVHTGFMSVRSKPQTGEIVNADNFYRKFKRNEQGRLFFQNGKIVEKSKSSKFSFWLRLTLQQRFISLALFSVGSLVLMALAGIYIAYTQKNTIKHLYYTHIESISQLTEIENIWYKNKYLLLSSLSINSRDNNLLISRKLNDNITKLGVVEKSLEMKVKEGYIQPHDGYKDLLKTNNLLISVEIKPITIKLNSATIDDQDRQFRRVILNSIYKIEQFKIKLDDAIKTNKLESKVIYLESEQHFIDELILSVVLTVIFMLLLFVGAYFFNRDIQLRLETIKRAFHRLMVQDYLFDIEILNYDEIGTVLQSLKMMKVRLAFNMEDVKQRATAATRIKIALDNASTSVIITDNHRNIIYANPASVKLFKGAEKKLKEVIPSLDPAKLVGSNIEQFYTKPEDHANLLANLTQEHHAQVDINGCILSMIATPVHNDKGVRIGTVAELEDRTLEVAMEKEIEDVIKAAVKGDFTCRMGLENKNKFFLVLCQNINHLLELSEVSLSDVIGVLSALAKGDLTAEITNDYEGVFGVLKDNSNSTATKLKEMIIQIKTSADTINTAATEIAIGNVDLSQRTERQACSLEVTASSMEEITTTVKQNSENAKRANELASTTSVNALEGGDIVAKVVQNMSDINTSSRQIMDIISVIDSIAFQTNILALNAAVEAARAGEQGRGFAVVATEVRNLAQRSATAAKEVKTLITTSVEKVELGTKLADQAGESISDVVKSIQEVAQLIDEITTASVEQSVGIDQVSSAIHQMDDVTQQNATLVEEASAAASSLQEQVANLAISVAAFETGDNNFTYSASSLANDITKKETGEPPIKNEEDWTDF
ncbi:MAG: PAS domain-containing protein [Psychromonas sp.]|nr:PAS domain-containing protein [Psychromonas sp.]